MLSMLSAAGLIIREPHLGHTNSGVPVAHLVLSVITNPEKQENTYPVTTIMEVSFFGNPSAVVMNYCRKGMQVAFAGTIQRIDTYQREDGSIGATLKVNGNQLHLPPKPATEQAAAPAPERATPAPAAPTTKAKAKAKAAVDEDECAFGIG